ncbi:MAG: decaprenyl-phosphate phosphoribosyltransferase, partial [Chloroflexi bacterium]|nr:decaprenyl-phosphate phosphoribosyltransferase [Chloroflexota bacterium]
RQWTKNGVIFVGLIFSRNLFDPRQFATVLAAFVLFCAISSAMYLFNDLADLERDREHPIKRFRPLASGALSQRLARIIACGLLAGALTLSLALQLEFGLFTLLYVGLMFAYNGYLKHQVILDVLTIAGGFVIRAVAGSIVINVPVSPWLYVVTILGALFLGFSKRRHELILLENRATAHRRILQEYTLEFLNQMITIVTASAVMAYSLYTFSADNLPKNHAMMLTIPFLLYGIFRYLYLIHLKNAGGSPEEVLLGDRPLSVNIGLWLLTSVLILYWYR